MAMLLIAVGAGGATSAAAAPPPADPAALRRWVAEMKASPRGPFHQIRWFCADGSVHPPGEYVCRERGGGVQHGEWSERVKTLRGAGFHIANVFADIKPPELLGRPAAAEDIRQMILEQYLVRADDGWIFRKARYYRGALQVEDEIRGGRALLQAMVAEAKWRTRDYTALIEAVRLIPHGRRGAPISEMRQLSRAIAEADRHFENLRIKIHVKPEAADAERVRAYAASRGARARSADYERLATVIGEVFQPRDMPAEIMALIREVSSAELSRRLLTHARRMAAPESPFARFQAACGLSAAIREGLPAAGGSASMLALLDAGLLAEAEAFQAGNSLIRDLPRATRRERLAWLAAAADGLFGVGLISRRQHQELGQRLGGLPAGPIQLGDYKSMLDDAARLSGWADRALRFQFTQAADTLSTLEPLVGTYFHDRLRGSLLLVYAAVLESLAADAGHALGVVSRLFDQTTPAGLTGLNPGIARGVLRVARAQDDPMHFDPRGIYLLPATTDELPPVAGIITAGRGNMLSHVQLLARSLGIPNVAAERELLPRIAAWEGRRVVLAVSPLGVVHLAADGPDWDGVFAPEGEAPPAPIAPDLARLDLSEVRLHPLQNVRSSDAGRICGPKAANLGELKQHFPEAVTEGVVIPFGVFKALLDQPLEPREPGGPSIHRWMQAQYALIRGLAAEPDGQRRAIDGFLKRISARIAGAEPGEGFRRELRRSLEQAFGPDGSYGVFVRSDTNVEDLPGFTGAGLNLTVPNVVGFENILAAILKVWASPFGERAYRWRQAYMDRPEHLYASVLLLKSVPAEKSGVMVTVEVERGEPGWLSVAVNEGVGGAVSGQTAEELRIEKGSGEVRLLSQATEPFKRVLVPEGGLVALPASGADAVLTAQEIDRLRDFAATVAGRFPALVDAEGRPVAADIEFGFVRGRLALFQIRPFLENTRARRSEVLKRLDAPLSEPSRKYLNLDERAWLPQ
jgi:hypothetical protein